MTRLFSGNCSAATEYERATDFAWTSSTNDPDAAPHPILKSIDNRLHLLETNIAAAAGWPGTSTAYGWLNTYNDTNGSGWEADTLDGQHGSYYLGDANRWVMDTGLRRQGYAPFNNMPFYGGVGLGLNRNYYGAARGDTDGDYWYFNTTASGGKIVRIAQSYNTIRGLLAATAVPTGAVLATGYVAKDVKYHDGYVYVLLRHAADGADAMLGKYNKRTLSYEARTTLANVTYVHRMAFGSEGFLWIGTQQEGAKAACVYNLDTMDYAVTNLGSQNNTVNDVWPNGYSASLSLRSVSHHSTSARGPGIINLDYNPIPPGSWVSTTCYHIEDAFEDIYDGGTIGHHCGYLLKYHKDATTNWRFVWQTRQDLWAGGLLAANQNTNSKVLSDTRAFETWAEVRGDRFVVAAHDTNAQPDVRLYQFMLATNVASARFNCTMVEALSAPIVQGNTHQGAEDVVFANGVVCVVCNGSATGPSSIVRDPLLGG